MVTAIIQHEVKDFNEWKKYCDQDVPNLVKCRSETSRVFILR